MNNEKRLIIGLAVLFIISNIFTAYVFICKNGTEIPKINVDVSVANPNGQTNVISDSQGFSVNGNVSNPVQTVVKPKETKTIVQTQIREVQPEPAPAPAPRPPSGSNNGNVSITKR